MRSPPRPVLVVAATVMTLAGCGLVRSTEAIQVTMGAEAWTVEPSAPDDANQLDFTFVNETSEAHSPIVVALATDEEVDPAQLVSRVVTAAGEGSDSQLVYPAGDSGRIGHHHPGGPDTPDLPDVAVTVIEDGGELIRYLFTDSVAPGRSMTESVTAGKAEFTFGVRNPGARYAVLCMNPDHFDRGEHAIFELAP